MDENSCQLTFPQFASLVGLTRQNIYKLVNDKKLNEIEVENDKGKKIKMLEVHDPINKYYLEYRGIDVDSIKIEQPEKIKKPVKEKFKKEKKQIEKKIITPEVKAGTAEKKTEKPELKSEKPVITFSADFKSPKKKDEGSLATKKLKIEIEKLEEQRNKLRLDNEEKRAELVRRDGLGDTCFGYLSALNQNIMSLPKSIIDDMEAGIKTKKTRSELINILTAPICEAIAETKEELRKEIAKAKKIAREAAEHESQNIDE